MKKIQSLTLILIPIIMACDHGRNLLAEREKEAQAIETSLNDITNYPTVTIGEQIWLAHNLGVSVFRNGDTIFQATTEEEWIKAGDNREPAWMYFEYWEPYADDRVLKGKHYNWFAVNDPRGLAPAGWRVPTTNDWNELLRHYVISEEKTRELQAEHTWEMPIRGTNLSGFDARAFGFCGSHSGCYNDGISAEWWTADSYNEEEAWYITMNRYQDLGILEWEKTAGLTVRLIKE